MSASAESLLHCTFCSKSQQSVKKLIAGPGVYICNECVDLCNQIIGEELDPNPKALLEQLRRSTADADELVQRLKDAGVAWDDIAAALRGDPPDGLDPDD